MLGTKIGKGNFYEDEFGLETSCFLFFNGWVQTIQ